MYLQQKFTYSQYDVLLRSPEVIYRRLNRSLRLFVAPSQSLQLLHRFGRKKLFAGLEADAGRHILDNDKLVF